MFIRNTKGQALVETVLSIFLLHIFIITTVQLLVYSSNICYGNYTAFRMTRCLSLAKQQKTENAGFNLLALINYARKFPSNFYEIKKMRSYAGKLEKRFSEGSPISYYSVFLRYGLKSDKSSSIFDNNDPADILKKDPSTVFITSSRFIKSPDEEFYKRAYPDADEFS